MTAQLPGPPAPPPAPATGTLPGAGPGRRSAAFAAVMLVLAGLISWPVFRLNPAALYGDLQSYALLVPFIAGYLIYTRAQLGLPAPARSPGGAAAFGMAGAAALLLAFAGGRAGRLPADVQLAGWVLGYLLLGVAAAFWLWGAKTLRELTFPVAFLGFALPLPVAVVNGFESFLQHASASASAGLFSLSGTQYVRSGLEFWLPGVRIEVAPECSGIRSTLVLLVTATLAAHLMLRRPWKQGALVLAVIPLGIARNAGRIFVLSMLSVHVDPAILDSPLHHRGGPLFFAASLLPLFLLLWLLRRSEGRPGPPSERPLCPAA